MDVQILGLYIFIIFLIYYVLSTVIIAFKYKGYSARKCTVSELGSTKNKFGKYFNLTTIIYGILAISLPYNYLLESHKSITNLLFTFFLSAVCIFTAIVGFFPINKNFKTHDTIGYLIFGSVISASLLFSLISKTNTAFASLYVPSLVLLVVSLILGLIKVITRDNSKCAFIEWISFLITIFWNLLFALILILY